MELSWFDRQIGNIILLYKIVNSLVEIPQTLLPMKARDGIKFQRIYGRVNAYLNSFVPATIQWWNDIPKEILLAGNLIEFKRKVLEYLSSF